MRRELYIMRHGHAKSRHPNGDLARELKDRGKRNAQRMGVWMSQFGGIPDRIISSPAQRAQVSAQKMIKAAGGAATEIELFDPLYQGKLKDLLKRVRQLDPMFSSVVMVGHGPLLDELAHYLSDQPVPRSSKGKVLLKGGLIRFSFEGNWDEVAEQCMVLEGLIQPKDLPEFFPYPDGNGTEKRIRPAYYYSQSCVVPYREKGNALEVMIVTSSKNHHWVTPKGIVEPGLTPQQSAANEAFEEAGIIGRVRKRPLGEYQLEKWEATCRVVVYLMEVKAVLADAEWEENHRRRQWVSCKEASRLLNNDDLAQIVLDLPNFLGGKKK